MIFHLSKSLECIYYCELNLSGDGKHENKIREEKHLQGGRGQMGKNKD